MTADLVRCIAWLIGAGYAFGYLTPNEFSGWMLLVAAALAARAAVAKLVDNA